MDEAFDRSGDLRKRLTAAIATLIEIAAKEQAAVVPGDGRVADPGRGGGAPPGARLGPLRRLLQRGFEESPTPHAVSELTVRGIVAGIRNTAYQRLREGRGAELPAAAGEIVEWILSFDRPPGEVVRAAAEAASRPAERPAAEAGARARLRGPAREDRLRGEPARRREAATKG